MGGVQMGLKGGAFQISLVMSLAFMSCGKKADLQNVSDAALNPTAAHLIGAAEVQPGDEFAQSTVALYYNDPGQDSGYQLQQFCSGTLVAPNIVLTAAHCLVDFATQLHTTADHIANNTRVGFGLSVGSDTDSNGVEFQDVKTYAVHPDYVNGSVSNVRQAMSDVAVLKLRRNAPSSAVPAKLITDGSLVQSGVSVTVEGFGYTSINPVERATAMNRLSFVIGSPHFNPTQFVVGGTATMSLCHGDSGSPAYLKLADGSYGILGVASWTNPACSQGGGLTSVPLFASWITSKINSL